MAALQKILLKAAAFFLLVASSSPSFAIDCARVRTKVEIATCSDGYSKQKDAELSKLYFALLQTDPRNEMALSASEQEVLRADQRRWLATREIDCGRLEPERAAQCVRDGLDRRIDQLKFEWGRSEADTSLVKSGKLTVGTETLSVTDDKEAGGYALEYRGKTVGWLGYQPDNIVVLRRLAAHGATAALVRVGVAATLQCGTDVVLENTAPGGLHIHKLATNCVSLMGSGSSGRIAQGFEFVRSPWPASPGERIVWSLGEGISKSKIVFSPEPGTKMASLFEAKQPNFNEPLRNEEFYGAVVAMTGKDRQRFLDSLWGVANGCDGCGGNAEQRLYGQRIDDDVISYSSCGWYMYGAHLNCAGDDALAVWQKSSGSFYFAIVPHDASASVEAYPPLTNWSKAALARFEAWRDGEAWSAKTE